MGDEIDDLIAANKFDDTGPVSITPLYPTASAAAASSSGGAGFWETLGKSLLATGVATTGQVVANQLGAKTPQQQAALVAQQQQAAAASNRQMLVIGGVVLAVIVGGALLLRRGSST